MQSRDLASAPYASYYMWRWQKGTFNTKDYAVTVSDVAAASVMKPDMMFVTGRTNSTMPGYGTQADFRENIFGPYCNFTASQFPDPNQALIVMNTRGGADPLTVFDRTHATT